MSQAQEIFSGFKNLIFKDEVIEAKAEVKLKICFECPFRKEVLGISKCSKCGCMTKAKVRSDNSTCPDKRW